MPLLVVENLLLNKAKISILSVSVLKTKELKIPILEVNWLRKMCEKSKLLQFKSYLYLYHFILNKNTIPLNTIIAQQSKN